MRARRPYCFQRFGELRLAFASSIDSIRPFGFRSISVSACEIPQRISGASAQVAEDHPAARRVCVRPPSVRPSEVSIIAVVSIGRKLQNSPHGVFQPKVDELKFIKHKVYIAQKKTFN